MSNDLSEVVRRIELVELKIDALGSKVDQLLGTSSRKVQIATSEPEVVITIEGVPVPDWNRYKIRVQGQLSWYCNVFHTCDSDLSGRVWMVDEQTGDIPTWNLIETTCNNGDIPGFDMSNGQWLRSARNATECGFGWGNDRDGKHDQATVWARFYSNFGYVTWRIYYDAR